MSIIGTVHSSKVNTKLHYGIIGMMPSQSLMVLLAWCHPRVCAAQRDANKHRYAYLFYIGLIKVGWMFTNFTLIIKTRYLYSVRWHP